MELELDIYSPGKCSLLLKVTATLMLLEPRHIDLALAS